MKLLMNQQGLLMKLVPHKELMKPTHRVVILDDGVENPFFYKQTMNDVNNDQWVKAMDLEMEFMYFNSVWKLVDLPEGVKPIGCKWIYKRKRDSAGKSIRILLSTATFYDFEIWKMDVKTAFLNGNLEESTIFMSQPEGLITQGQDLIPNKRFGRSTICSSDSNHKGSCGVHLSKKQCLKTHQEVKYMRCIPYASTVDNLMYAMLCTTPGICNAVGIVSSIKQGCIADSTMEPKYVAACEATKEIVWLMKFLHDLEVVLNMNMPITLYCDNSGIVANFKDPPSRKRGKHIKKKYHLIREIVQRGDVNVTKIALEHNIADPFTKTLTAKVFEGHLENLVLRDIYIR
ncbi:gag/pol protein [Cucumis melo var. makuwa]|uniref:Gag/pol protein n=1 Tax=Cucumis melo var. makuwa TaxID=1194695 RepID=A0A5A7TL98_CUCMM|nr:gag/pol protein [Cucumis melo var. makuwa]TYK29753.1 gag/pol protein [Cucumis melo var. makuwa]